MRAIIQRVTRAEVKIDGKVVGKIEKGLVILLGIKNSDDTVEGEFLAKKIANLRIFEDNGGKMNLSLIDNYLEALVVPNFTLYANAKNGNRPSYTDAADPETANNLYQYFIGKLRNEKIKKIDSGVFGADMQVELENDGPVTIILDTDEIMPKK